MKELKIKDNEVDIYLGKDGAGFHVLEIDLNHKEIKASFRTIDDDKDIHKFMSNAETILKECLASINDKKFIYSKKLVNGGQSVYKDSERKAYDSLKLLQDNFESYANMVRRTISESVERGEYDRV